MKEMIVSFFPSFQFSITNISRERGFLFKANPAVHCVRSWFIIPPGLTKAPWWSLLRRDYSFQS